MFQFCILIIPQVLQVLEVAYGRPIKEESNTRLYTRADDGIEAGFPDEENIFSVIIPFAKQAISQLQQNKDLENKIRVTIDQLLHEIPEEHPNTSFIRCTLNIIQKFVNNGYFIKFTTIVEIIKKVNKHMSEKPNTFSYNMSKMKYRTMKGVGNAIENTGDIAAGGVKTIKDLYKKQARVSNRFAEKLPLPYLANAVKIVNAAVTGGLEALHLSMKFGLSRPGKSLVDKAENGQKRLKEEKLKSHNKEATEKTKPPERGANLIAGGVPLLDTTTGETTPVTKYDISSSSESSSSEFDDFDPRISNEEDILLTKRSSDDKLPQKSRPSNKRQRLSSAENSVSEFVDAF